MRSLSVKKPDMPTPRKIIVSWSGGKDSAWMLHQLLQDPAWEVVGLFTTLNQEAERVAMHGVHAELLPQQARSIGLPLFEIGLPFPCDNASYEAAVGSFLEDIRQYRENQLSGTGLEPIFPIWLQPTKPLSRKMLAAGISAVITCIDPRKLPTQFAVRNYDEDFLNDLPETCIPVVKTANFTRSSKIARSSRGRSNSRWGTSKNATALFSQISSLVCRPAET